MAPPVQQHALEAPRRAFYEDVAVRTRSERLVGIDLVALVDVWVLLAVMWAARLAHPLGRLDPTVALFGISLFAALLAPRAAKLHRRALSPSAIDDTGDLLRRVWIAYAIASAVGVFTGIGSLRMLLAVAVVTVPALLVSRAAGYAAERSLRQKSRRAPTVVVGAGDIARRVIKTIAEHEEYGLEVVGAADDRPKYGASELGARLIGGLDEVGAVVKSRGVQNVIVAFSHGDQGRLVGVIRNAMQAGATVWVVPRFFELSAGQGGGDHLWGLPLVRLQPPPRTRPEWILKRTVDVVLSALGLIVAAPVMAAIALAVLVESGRPVLYRQSRVGVDGRPFEILKFRSMAAAPRTIENTEWAPDDMRVTRVGRFIRNTSLDELPQLFNVLRGDMSLVGPRPERPYFVGLFEDLYPQYGDRHRLPAGVTGWAQIHGLKGDTSIEERAIFDNYYIENWSLSKDLKIIAKTALTFFRTGRGGER